MRLNTLASKTMTMQCTVIPDAELTVTHLDNATRWRFVGIDRYGKVSELATVLAAADLPTLTGYIQDASRHDVALTLYCTEPCVLQCHPYDSESDGQLQGLFSLASWDNDDPSGMTHEVMIAPATVSRLIHFLLYAALDEVAETPQFGL